MYIAYLHVQQSINAYLHVQQSINAYLHVQQSINAYLHVQQSINVCMNYSNERISIVHFPMMLVISRIVIEVCLAACF